MQVVFPSTKEAESGVPKVEGRSLKRVLGQPGTCSGNESKGKRNGSESYRAAKLQSLSGKPKTCLAEGRKEQTSAN